MSAAPYGTSLRGFGDARPSAGRILGGLDPALLLATLGLVACSIYTLSTATKSDIPGDPNFFVFRQSLYVAVGLLLMLAISRIDYSRLREWKAGLYGVMIGLIVLVYVFGGVTRGSKRAIQLPFFEIQTSELGKILLIVTLSAFVVDRMRRMGAARPPAGSCCWRCSRRCSSSPSPTSGRASVHQHRAAILFVAGTSRPNLPRWVPWPPPPS